MSTSAPDLRTLGEWAALGQLPRLAWRAPRLLAGPRGQGAPVLVFPGRGVGDASTAPMRAYLRTLGYRVRGWGLGTNDGDLGRLIPAAADAVQSEAEQAGRPIALVGQSMGGHVAREVARLLPNHVDRVITLGSPLVRSRSSRPIRCPVVAVWSAADRVVAPSWAIDRSAGVTMIEVHSTHFGMGFDPDVWRILARHLRAPVA